jgi:hypothetical protein
MFSELKFAQAGVTTFVCAPDFWASSCASRNQTSRNEASPGVGQYGGFSRWQFLSQLGFVGFKEGPTESSQANAR